MMRSPLLAGVLAFLCIGAVAAAQGVDGPTVAEFHALEQRVAALEEEVFSVPEPEPSPTHSPHPSPEPSPEAPSPEPPSGFDRVLSGQIAGATVPAGETWKIEGLVESTANVVVEGTLVMRPGATLRFVGVNEAAFVGGGMDPVASDIGLWVMGDGVLDALGSPKLGWVRTTSDLAAGATVLTLEKHPVGWQMGDRLVITPTIAPGGSTEVNEAFDERTIAAISGRTITLNSGLTHPHPAVAVGKGLVYGAEVMNMTRDVVIEGTPGGRSHIFIRTNGPQTIKHITIRHTGPKKHQGVVGKDGPIPTAVVGRYGLHFHMMDDASRGTLVEGVVVELAGSHAYVAHRSHGVMYRDSIADRTELSQWWWDAKELPDTEHFTNDTVHDHVIGSRRLNMPGSKNSQNMRDGAFDILRGTGNVLRDSVAVGGDFAIQAGGLNWQAAGEGFTSSGEWIFEGRTVTHNNGANGSMAWENNQTGERRFVRGIVAYHNGEYGFEHGAYKNNYHYIDVISYGNGVAAVLLHANTGDEPDEQVWRDCLLDAAGTDAAVLVDKHTTPGFRPTRFVGCQFRGATVAQVFDKYQAADDKAQEFLHFERSTFGTSAPAFFFGTQNPLTRWRVQDSLHGCIELSPVAGGMWNPAWQAYVRPVGCSSPE